MTGPYLLRCVLLVRSWWDSAIMWFNLWPVYSHMCLYDGTWCQLHHEEVASSANSYPNCHYDIYPGHIEYLRHTVFIGNRFLWLYINFCLPPWFWCIIKESANFLWWVSRGREEGSCMFLQIGGMKNERGGTDTPFRPMGDKQPKICSFLPPGKNPPSHMGKSPSK